MEIIYLVYHLSIFMWPQIQVSILRLIVVDTQQPAATLEIIMSIRTIIILILRFIIMPAKIRHILILMLLISNAIPIHLAIRATISKLLTIVVCPATMTAWPAIIPINVSPAILPIIASYSITAASPKMGTLSPIFQWLSAAIHQSARRVRMQPLLAHPAPLHIAILTTIVA